MQIPTLLYVFLKVFVKRNPGKLFKYFNLQDWMDWTFISDGNNGKDTSHCQMLGKFEYTLPAKF